MGSFPRKLSQFSNYLTGAIPYLDANKVRLKIDSVSWLPELMDSYDEWKIVFANDGDPGLRTRINTVRKYRLRAEIEKLLRQTFADIPESVLTVADCIILKIKKRPEHRSRITVIGEPPNVFVTRTEHMMHMLRITNPLTPESRAMPYKHHVQLAYGVGEIGIPFGEVKFDRRDFVSRHTHRVNFQESDFTKTVYYRARYVNTRGDTGAWSQIKSAIVV